MKTALIISTYNRPSALALCLESVRLQTKFPDEIVIADDGSDDKTKFLIENISRDFPVPIRHVWHEDLGFRLAMIRNKAIAATNADFIIQIDGDIILHRRYIEDYCAVIRPHTAILGSRINLEEHFSASIESNGKWFKIYPFSKGVEKNKIKTLYFRLGRIVSKNYKRNRLKVCGCSMAFWRNDFIEINGYDESFVGWGWEDIDLISRLGKNGVNNHKLIGIGIFYHLWHKEADRVSEEDNHQNFLTKNKDVVRCEKGISQYL